MNHPRIGAGVVFALALIIYTLSLAPGVFSWDSAELTLGIYTQGIVHATGYPLYLILGRLFTLVPLSDDFAVRANLFSALCGALTVTLLYLICLRLTERPMVAAGSALLYGLAREIWAQAVVAEVYTLHTMLTAGIVLVVVRVLSSSHATALGSKPKATETLKPLKRLETDLQPLQEFPEHFPARHFERLAMQDGETILLAVLFGLALANHMAALLVAAVILPYVLWRLCGWRWRIIFIGITGCTTALLYVYLPLRFAAQPEFSLVAQYFERNLTQPADLLWMVSGRMFGREMLAYPLLDWLGEIGKFIGELALNYLGAGVVLGLFGIRDLWRRNRTLCLLLSAIFAAQVLFFSSYDVFDKWTMFHTAYLVWGIFVAVGCRTLGDQLPRGLIHASLAALIAAQVLTNWNVAGRADDTFVADRTAAMLAALPPDATLIGPWTTLRPVEYLQIVEGERRDVRLVDLTLLALGERDRLNSDDTSVLEQAVDGQLATLIACAPDAVYVVDPAALDVEAYEVAFVQSGLYRVTKHPAGKC